MEADTIALMITIVGSWLTIFVAILWQSNRHEDSIKALDTKFSGKIDALDTKFTGKIDALDTKFTGKIDALGRDVSDARERLARVEGHLMAPEGFALGRGRQPPPDDPVPTSARPADT